MVLATCSLCEKEFNDSHSGRKGLKFCCRQHFREYKQKHGTWNKGKNWKDVYSPETLAKMKTRITAKGSDHFNYSKKRPDNIIRNVLKNPMYSEEKKKELQELVKKEGISGIIKLVADSVPNKKFYQRIAYEAWGKNCLNCGKTKEEMQIGIHHIDKNRKNNNPFNLIPLCNKCHVALENRPEDCKMLLKKA